MLAVATVLCLCVAGVLSAPSDSCPPCNRELCARPKGCASGIVSDRCNCCEVCGKLVGESCNVPSVGDSACGQNMTCRAHPAGSLCVCDHQEELCGNDGRTYKNICHMKMAKQEKGNKGLGVATIGPCKRKPSLVTGPLHTTNRTGGYVALSCEADGVPIPTIEWLYTRVDGIVRHLPGDHEEISVNLRGGPVRNQITGWVQIINLVKDHEGYYTCMAHNEQGRVEGMARIFVRD